MEIHVPAESEQKQPTPHALTTARLPTVLRRCFCSIVVVLLARWMLGKQWTNLFQYHPISMTVCFLGLMPELLYVSRSLRKCRSMNERSERIGDHLLLATMVKTLALVGFIAIYVDKNHRGKKHFTTWHGLMGVITVLVVAFQVLVGLAYHFRLGPWRKFSAYLSTLRKIHKYCGIAVLLLGSISMFLGWKSNFATKLVASDVARLAFGSVTTGASVWTFTLE